ncbi:MAG: septum site-determining protein MinD [Firmicutes bacterium]|nr:septum site-determining protein MinD [Bacillota bacterium]
MAEVLAIVSGKGGVGKTTAAANIGTALAAMGHKVLLIDADVGLRNLDAALGMQDRSTYHFLDIINNQCSLEKAIVKDERYPGLALLLAPQFNSIDDIDGRAFKRMINSFKKNHDYILIDCAAGIGKSFEMACDAADTAIIVATPDILSIRDADRVAAMLEKRGADKAFLIINKINVDMVKKGDMIDIDTIVNAVAVSLIGAVPLDEYITISINKGKPAVLLPKSNTGVAFLNIAKRITGAKVPIMKLNKKRFFLKRR